MFDGRERELIDWMNICLKQILLEKTIKQKWFVYHKKVQKIKFMYEFVYL